MRLIEASQVDRNKYWTVSDVLSRYVITYNKLKGFVHRGKIGGIIHNHTWYLDKCEVDNCLKNVRVNGYCFSEDVVKRLNIAYMTLYKWKRKGKIKHIRRGHRYLYPESEIERILNEAEARHTQIRGIDTIAEYMNTSPYYIRLYIKDKGLPAKKVNNVWIVEKQALDDWRGDTRHDPVSVTDLSRKIRVCRFTIYNWINAGKIRTVKVGKLVYVDGVDAYRLIQDYESRPSKMGLTDVRSISNDLAIDPVTLRSYALQLGLKPRKYLGKLHFSKTDLEKILKLAHQRGLEDARKQERRDIPDTEREFVV